MPRLHCLVVSAACLLVASCGGMPRTIKGKVINHLDGSPIADAFVIATWTYHGADFVGSRSGCSWIDIVQSDSEGRYAISPRWGGEPDELEAYKPRFTTFYPGRPNNVMTQEDIAKYLVLKELVPYSGPVEKQQPSRNWLWYNISCERGDKRTRFGALYQALDDEGASLGVERHYMKRLTDFEELQKRESATHK